MTESIPQDFMTDPVTEAIRAQEQPIVIAAGLCDDFGLEPGVNCDLQVATRWSDGPWSIRLSCEYQNLDPSVRRNIKRYFGRLEIPEWQKHEEVKWLIGTKDLGENQVRVTMTGAMRCEKVRDEVVDRSQRETEQIEDLAQLSDAQILYLSKLALAEARQPKTRPVYRCQGGTIEATLAEDDDAEDF